jgi:hypothetical protein
MDSPNIKRRYLRRDVTLPIKFELDGESRSCLTTTIGEGGMYLQSLLPPPVGTRLSLEFELLEGQVIKVTGEVRHSLSNNYGSLPAGFGVQFLDLTEKDRNLILDFVNSEAVG